MTAEKFLKKYNEIAAKYASQHDLQIDWDTIQEYSCKPLVTKMDMASVLDDYFHHQSEIRGGMATILIEVAFTA